MKAPLTNQTPRKVAGFSVLELLIVVTMITVVAGFVVMQVVRARQVMVRENAARELMSYLEKARVDSVRRRPTAAATMAQVTILDSSFYTVTTDASGDGALDAPKVLSLPAGVNLEFQPPFPRTIYFNWRGRTVDAAGNLTNPAYVRIRSTAGYGSSQVDLTQAGETSLDGPPPISTVQNSNAPPPTFREKVQVP